jgi:hypothetical protein
MKDLPAVALQKLRVRNRNPFFYGPVHGNYPVVPVKHYDTVVDIFKHYVSEFLSLRCVHIL